MTNDSEQTQDLTTQSDQTPTDALPPREIRMRTIVGGLLTIAFSILMFAIAEPRIDLNFSYVLVAIATGAGLLLLINGIHSAMTAGRNRH